MPGSDTRPKNISQVIIIYNIYNSVNPGTPDGSWSPENILLAPRIQFLNPNNFIKEMRVRSAVRRLCKDCRVVKRRKRLYVTCKRNPRHKQRQGFSTTTTSIELVPSTTLLPAYPSTATLVATNNQPPVLHSIVQPIVQPFGAFHCLSVFR